MENDKPPEDKPIENEMVRVIKETILNLHHDPDQLAASESLLTPRPVAWEPMGPIHISGEVQGSYSHCAIKEFTSADEVTEFFTKQTNCVVTHLLSVWNKIVCVYTRQLTPEELGDIQEWDRERKAFFEKRAAEREAEQERIRADQAAAQAEQKRLAELGKRCEQNHPKRLGVKVETVTPEGDSSDAD